jgi:hypothetical protein
MAAARKLCNVCLNDMPSPRPSLFRVRKRRDRWETLLRLREDVNKALELARGTS